jgi:hypothetical protein
MAKVQVLTLQEEEQIRLPRSIYEQLVAEARDYAVRLNQTAWAIAVRAALGLPVNEGPFYANGAECAESWVRGDLDSILTTDSPE